MKSLAAILALFVIGASLVGCSQGTNETVGTPPKEGEFKTAEEVGGVEGKTKDPSGTNLRSRG